MIVVAGFFRTGTAIMMRCLGEPLKYRRMENPRFRALNGDILEINGCTQKNKVYFNKPKKLIVDKETLDEILLSINNESAIKDPQILLTIEILKQIETFVNAKYLVPVRDFDCVIQSFMKLKDISKEFAIKTLDEYWKNFQNHWDGLNYCLYRFEDFLRKDKETIQKINDFIGYELNLDRINLDLWHYRQ